jgi:hypothetical protein
MTGASKDGTPDPHAPGQKNLPTPVARTFIRGWILRDSAASGCRRAGGSPKTWVAIVTTLAGALVLGYALWLLFHKRTGRDQMAGVAGRMNKIASAPAGHGARIRRTPCPNHNRRRPPRAGRIPPARWHRRTDWHLTSRRHFVAARDTDQGGQRTPRPRPPELHHGLLPAPAARYERRGRPAVRHASRGSRPVDVYRPQARESAGHRPVSQVTGPTVDKRVDETGGASQDATKARVL